MIRKVTFESFVILTLMYLCFGALRLGYVAAGKGGNLTYMPLIDGPWNFFIDLMG